MKIFIKVIFLVLLAFYPVQSAFSNLTYADAITQGYSFIEPKIEQITIEGNVYSSVTVEGLPSTGEVGAPQLPVKGAMIYIPQGKKLSSSTVTLSEPKAIFLEHQIMPVQKEYPLSFEGQVEAVLPDSSKYVPLTENVKEVSVQRARGYDIAVFNLFPVVYFPEESKILYYSQMELKIKLEEADPEEPNVKKRSLPSDQKQILEIIDNKEDLPALPSEKIDSVSSLSLNEFEDISYAPVTKSGGITLLGQQGPFDYVIITNQALNNSTASYKFQDLVNIRESATIVTTDDPVSGIYSNYSGVDNQTKIRNFIIDAYNNWGTQYVLLGGDVSIIPHRSLRDTDEDGETIVNIPSDLYYAALDGNFDNNNNNIYGEKYQNCVNLPPPGGIWCFTVDEVDYLAEVYTGRVPVDNTTQLSNFIKKVLAYEQDKANLEPYLYNTLQAGEHLGFGGLAEWAKWMLEEIRLGSSNYGFTNVGFSNKFDNQTLYQYDIFLEYPVTFSLIWELTLQTMLNSNDFHIVNHLGHANESNLMKLNISEVDGMTNTKYFIGYSQGCYPGAFDYSDSIIEHFIYGSHGAVAFIANTRYGYGATPNSTQNSSNYYARQFWHSIFEQKIYELGKANQVSKENNLPFLNYSKNRFVYLELTLFGDPALKIFADEQSLCSNQTYFQSRNNDSYVDGTANLNNPSDYACCLDDDCVYNGVCYYGGESNWSFTSHLITHGTNKKLICSNLDTEQSSMWLNVDYFESYCQNSGYHWHVDQGDANVESGYNPHGGLNSDARYCSYNFANDSVGTKTKSTECCCGDDNGEYYMVSPHDGSSACCNTNGEFVLGGVCQNYLISQIPEVCGDGIDNNYNGLADECSACGCSGGLNCNTSTNQCVPCVNNNNCNDGTCITNDTCVNPGQSNSYCAHSTRPNNCGNKECGTDGCYSCGTCVFPESCGNGYCRIPYVDCNKYPSHPLCKIHIDMEAVDDIE